MTRTTKTRYPATPTATADQTYRAATIEARRLMAVITASIDLDVRLQSKDTRNWGYAGTMGSVVEALREVAIKLDRYADGDDDVESDIPGGR